MKRFLTITLFLASALAPQASQAAEPSVAFRSAKVANPHDAKDDQTTVVNSPRPNFVFILLDDLGWQGLHCFGDTFFETPQIDRLAAEGMKFTDAYAACHVCSPTRASIMTGQYPARLHLTDYIPGRDEPFAKLRQPNWTKQLPRDATTLAEALKPLGYVSASIGKWHLGGPGSQPIDHGFDVSFGDPLGGGHRGMFWPYGRPRVDGVEGQYLTDQITDEAIKFIDANRDKPFFLYLSHYAVHNPVEAKADRVERYRAKLDPDDNQHDPTYAAMIDSVDESTGRVLDRLEELGIDDRTVVIFVSDNGPLKPYSRPSPLRASKGTIYEGGIRVPMIVRWPAVTRPGSVCDVPVSSVDFFPTILEIAGAEPRQVDGESLVPLLKQEGPLDRDAIYWHYPHYSNHLMPPCGAIRQRDFKLVELYEDGRLQLFNLKDDLGETRNLAAAMPEKTKELHAKLEAWRKSVGAQRMTPNPDYDPAKTQWNRRKGRVFNIHDKP